MPQSDPGFTAWKASFGLNFSTDEDAYRYVHWLQAKKRNDAAQAASGNLTAFAHNGLSGQSPRELDSLNGYKAYTRLIDLTDPAVQALLPPAAARRRGLRSFTLPPSPPSPPPFAPAVDWTAVGKVGAVGYQGSCGDCYVWASVGAVESAWAIAHSAPAPTLSEQASMPRNGGGAFVLSGSTTTAAACMTPP